MVDFLGLALCVCSAVLYCTTVDTYFWCAASMDLDKDMLAADAAQSSVLKGLRKRVGVEIPSAGASSSSSGLRTAEPVDSGEAAEEIFDFDEDVYADFVRHAKRKMIAPAVKMPWERRLETPKVFHELPKQSIAMTKQDLMFNKTVEQVLDETDEGVSHLRIPKMPKRAPKISWEQRLTALRAAAIAKWKTILEYSLKSFQPGIQFLNEPHLNIGDVLEDVLAAKATSTLHARADAVVRFIAWCKIAGHVPIPFSEAVVYAFINDEGSRSAPTFPRSFCCALAFVGHVIGCPSALGCVDSKRVIGHAAKCYKEKRMLKQKPPIKVEHVRILENILQGKPKLKTQDKVAAGFFLWMIYARARFSDAQAASTIVEDVVNKGSGPFGFIEAQVHRSKTSVSLERKTRYLPMTAPINGVLPEDCHWGLQWMQSIRDSKLPIGAGRPLLPAQTGSGWSSLPVTAAVAAVWLKSLLRQGGASGTDLNSYGTHSCKATMLSWCAKFGVDPKIRAHLGYHSKSSGTELIYSRDAMALPLRELMKVLDKVRSGEFHPDETRSGYLASHEESGSSSSEGSEDEEEPEHEQIEQAQEKVLAPFRGNFDVKKMEGMSFFRHPVSRVIHMQEDESGIAFRCGRPIHKTYLHLGEGLPKFLHPTCKQCFNKDMNLAE